MCGHGTLQKPETHRLPSLEKSNRVPKRHPQKLIESFKMLISINLLDCVPSLYLCKILLMHDGAKICPVI